MSDSATLAHPLAQPAILPLGAATVPASAARFAALAAIGLALPFATHAIGGATGIALGPILMPLMIPVFLGAFLLPLGAALALAVLLPVASHMTSGMPPFAPMPIAQGLMVEGVATALAVWAVARFTKAPWPVVVLAGILANRAAGALFLLAFTSAPLKVLLPGFAGLALNFAFFPLLAKLFGRRP